MNRTLISSATVVLILAGCLGSGGAPSSRHAGPEALVDDDTGAIVGVVTDDNLAPVADAFVVLDGQITQSSDAAGAFAFAQVAPGDHEVSAGKDGYASDGRTVTVAAGEKTEAALRIVPLAIAEAYHEIFIQSGTNSCAVAVHVLVRGQGVAVCSVLQSAGLDLDRTYIAWNRWGFGSDVVGFWGETTWRSTQTLSNRFFVGYYGLDKPGDTVSGDIAGVVSASPARVRVPVSVIVNATVSGKKVCADFECPMEAWHLASARNDTAVDVVLILQQRYTDYLSVFHRGILPVSYTALPDA